MNSEMIRLVSLISIGHLAYAVLYFLKSGRSLLLVSNSFVIASALFIGVPGWVTCIFWPGWIDANYLLISVLGFLFSFGVSTVSFLVRTVFVRTSPPPIDRQISLSAWRFLFALTWLTIVVSVLAMVAASMGSDLGPLPSNLAYLAVVLSFVQFVIAKNAPVSQTTRWLVLITAALVLVGYFSAYFDGGGRLIVATLLYTLAAILGFWFPKIAVKRAILFGMIPAVMFFGYIRSKTGDFKDVLVAADGLESVFGPYQICASVFEHVDLGVMPLQNFAPLKSTLFFWVPRFLWQDKPVGFGFELTKHFHPELMFQEHSMAATYLGEMYASFGWLAVVVGFLVLVLGITWADLFMARLYVLDSGDKAFLMRMVILAVLSAGVFDYVWVGSFTFFSRNVLRLFLLFVLAGVIWALNILAVSGRSVRLDRWTPTNDTRAS